LVVQAATRSNLEEALMSTMYRDLVAEGDADSAPRRIRVDREDDRALITLSDPERLNVLSAPLVRQLRAALEQLTADADTRSIVLTGDDPAFSAGGDLRMMDSAVAHLDDPPGNTDAWRWIRKEFGAIARLIAHADTTFIAAINGAAAGVGLAWALTCDIAIASERALIVPAFGRLGLLPEVGTSWALTRRLGYQGAFAYYLRGEHIDAEAALQMGLVQEVVSHERLLEVAGEWCDRVSAMPEHAMEMTKPLLRAAVDASWDGALVLEEFAEPSCFTTQAFAGAVQGMLAR
jgi:2-(1,2-epoxy-1,2-dihydrophenyl)acetyl-CoA isomerase